MRKLITENFFTIMLFVLLIGLGVTNFLPSMYLIGWDNFSAYLDPITNIYRTIFATWRSYRGLGSPSDSEVTDFTRQIFYIIFSFLPAQTLEQFYVFATLLVGTIGVYNLIIIIIQERDESNPKSKFTSFLSTIIFLFSLNTIGTYFLPMPMYVTRFALFPWAISSFIQYLQFPNPKKLLLFAVIIFLTSASYLTATVSITLLITFCIISVTKLRQIKSSLLLFFVFFLVNSYWLYPFLNYTINKSSHIPLSSVFTLVNENQLNESPSHFKWQYLLSLYPSFLHIDSATNLNNGTSTSLHPHTDLLNPNNSNNWPVYILSVLGILGSLPALFSKNRSWARFIPLIIILCLFMLRKEHSPLGQFYNLLGEKIPYFKILFRFSDSKFNYLLALASALGIGCGTSWVVSLSSSKIYQRIIILPLIVIATYSIVHFLPIFKSSLISNLVYTSIPQPYFEIASVINRDNDHSRVLHLPIDRLSYFKSHSWGYFGSSFMAFLLEHPLLDRAFAPASPTNDSVDLQIMKIAQNFRNLKEESAVNNRLAQFERILEITNAKYIIHDQTVSVENTEDNLSLWGEFMSDDYTSLITAATQREIIRSINEYNVDVSSPNSKITLYQKSKPNLATQTLTNINPLSNHQDQVLQITSDSKEHHYQHIANDAYYPFLQAPRVFTNVENSLTAELPTEFMSGLIQASNIDRTTHNYQLYLSKTENDLAITIIHLPYPLDNDYQPESTTISIPLSEIVDYLHGSSSHNNYSTDWHTLPYTLFNDLRLSINNIVIPLPLVIETTPQYLTTITTKSPPYNIVLFGRDKEVKLDSTKLLYTQNPNCFNDSGSGYEHNLSYTNTELTLRSTNGTTCLAQSLPFLENSSYFELNFNTDLDNTNRKTANYFTACLLNESSECLNNHNTFNQNVKSLTLAPSTLPTPTTTLLITLPTIGEQTSTLTLSPLSMTYYKTLSQHKIDLNLNYPPAKLNSTTNQIVLPKSLSVGGYYFNQSIDALRTYNELCKDENAYRTTELGPFNSTIAIMENCSSGLYIPLHYDPSHFYLWNTSYKLKSGKYPTFLLASPTNSYLQSFLSWNQGYPNTKNLPDFTQTSILSYSQPGLSETAPRLFTISQNGENKGIFEINNFNIMELPTAWQNLSISKNSSIANFAKNVSVKEEKSILPSLWKITIQEDVQEKLPTFLHFSQAYDAQWELYKTDSPILALLGFGKVAASHVTVNGLTNGWIINNQNVSGNYYALYAPERLAILGWLVTTLTLLFLIFHKRLIRSHPSHSA